MLSDFYTYLRGAEAKPATSNEWTSAGVGAHLDDSIREYDTSSRGLTASGWASSMDSSEHTIATTGSDETDNDINKIPPHKRWSNVPIRYAYRVENLDAATALGSSDERWSWRTFSRYCGPGFLVAIAYLDPGNLEANLQAGAYTKYDLIWVLFCTCGIGLMLQGMAARVGIVTGKHLAQLCRQEYNSPRWISLWVMSEISIIASDVQAVITSAIALKILFRFPLWFGCILTACDALTFLSIHLLGIQSLELFFVAIVAAMSVCFFWTFSMNLPDPSEVLKGVFIPYVPSYGLHTAVGVIGSLILPQNYYVHSAVVLSREIDRTNAREVREANKYLLVDAAVALCIAALINFAVTSTFAEQFFNPDCAMASTTSACIADNPNFNHDHYGECRQSSNNAAGFCQHIGLSDADAPLKASLGQTAGLVWALGLLASGQSSTMTITYAGQFINEVIAAVLEATHPSSMDDATQLGNIIASICVPFTILPMLKFCVSSRLMGAHTVGWGTIFATLLVTGFLISINAMLFYETIMKIESISRQLRWLITVVVITSYTWFNYLMIDEEAEMFFDYWFVYFGWKQHRRFYKGEDLAQNPEMDATFSANLPTKSQTGRDVPVV